MTQAPDNLERFPGVGGSADITAHPTYNPREDVGSYSDFARDFLEAGGGGTLLSEPLQGSANDLSNTDDDPKTADVVSVGGNDAQVVLDIGAAAFNTGQFGIPAAQPTQVLVPNGMRVAVTILNLDTASTVYVGPNSSVNVDSGFPIAAGNSLTVSLSAAIWMIADNDCNIALLEYLAS